MYRMKKTKIVATMSDFRCTEEFVKQLFDAGMDVVRINSAHVSEESATRIVETVHRVNPAIPIMIDTKGPEIRVTTIADEYGNSIHFREGDRVVVRGSDGSDLTTRKVVYMNVPTIVRDIPVGAAHGDPVSGLEADAVPVFVGNRRNADLGAFGVDHDRDGGIDPVYGFDDLRGTLFGNMGGVHAHHVHSGVEKFLYELLGTAEIGHRGDDLGFFHAIHKALCFFVFRYIQLFPAIGRDSAAPQRPADRSRARIP